MGQQRSYLDFTPAYRFDRYTGFYQGFEGGAVRAASAELAELEVYTYRTQSILYTNDLALLSLAFLSRLLKIVVSPPSDRSQDSRIS